MKKAYLLKNCLWGMAIGLTACSTQKQLSSAAQKLLLQQPALATAHTGISIMDLNTGRYLHNYQGDKYFIPASNVKLLTCYTAMKYLGDSLDGMEMIEMPNSIQLVATGDPTLLHPDFVRQPVYDFLKAATKPLQTDITPWTENAYGTGWAWDDFSDDYMAERSVLPIYGNLLTISGRGTETVVTPAYFNTATTGDKQQGYVNTMQRSFHSNIFHYTATGKTNKLIGTPFITSDSLNMVLLADTLHKPIMREELPVVTSEGPYPKTYIIHSQPTDSLLHITMHRSDNFYAEQSLLMAGRKRLHDMRAAAIIQKMLEDDYKAMPQRPRWVDGSGLSRYNLVTPQDFVWLLAKMKQEFSWARITGILQTGDKGTLSGYYKSYAGRIYAKTGTLSNNVALSGYLVTNAGKTLAFSVIVNNHQAAASAIRREVETFLTNIIKEY